MRSQTYGFLGLTIEVRSDIAGLFEFIDRHTNLRPAEGEPGIRYHLEAGSPEEPDAAPDDTADFILHGVRKYRRYSRDAVETWHAYEGIGSVYHHYERGLIRARCLESGPDFLTLYVLFAQALTRAMARWNRFFLHGACLVHCGKGVLISGVSGRGKSTAAYALMADGARALTDEAVILDAETGRAASLMHVVKLREDAVARFFPEARPFYREDGDLYFHLKDLGVDPPAWVDRIDDLFILEKTGRPETEIFPVGPTRVFPELFPSTVNPGNPYRLPQRIEAFCALIGGARCHAVRFGTDMGAFAQCVREALGG